MLDLRRQHDGSPAVNAMLPVTAACFRDGVQVRQSLSLVDHARRGALLRVVCFYQREYFTSMYFEDFHTGQHIRTEARTVTAGELDAFLDLAGLHLPMFLHDEGAREVGHPRRLVTGPMILAVALGLARAHGCFDQVVAALEFNHVRFLRAVHPGDSLRVAITVLETRPTRDPDRGLVRLDFNALNQEGATVLAMQGSYLFRRLGAGQAVHDI